MKKISKFLFGAYIVSLGLISCQHDLTSLNDDPKHPSVLPSGNLLATALYQSSYYMDTPSVNYNNYRFFTQLWAETTYNDETQYDLVTRNQPRNHFNRMYVYSINNLKSAKKALESESGTDEVINNKWATLEIEEIFIWENVVDTYGDVPYSEAFDPDGHLSPKYDDAHSIYTDLIGRLDDAIGKISTSSKGYSSEDLIYYGDMSKWKKFANSVKLRLAMNLADIDPGTSKSAAESAIASGVIDSEESSYKFKYDGGTFVNPVYDNVVASGRDDFLPSSIVVDLMNSTSDPRRDIWFTKVDDEYKGGVFGPKNSYEYFSHLGASLIASTAYSQLLPYAEVLLLEAEAAARQYSVGGTAENFYNKAVEASMSANGISATDISAYLQNNPYDANNWKKSIGTQAFITLFNTPFGLWNINRRLDYPVLQVPSGSNTTTVPHRMPYSDQEYVLNKQNVEAAASAIGGDKAETKLFWDIY
ncbi:SusD/RagB family nutrient-binding outer membrane lipoprotein [Weeksellaceae bacterium A-14]